MSNKIKQHLENMEAALSKLTDEQLAERLNKIHPEQQAKAKFYVSLERYVLSCNYEGSILEQTSLEADGPFAKAA